METTAFLLTANGVSLTPACCGINYGRDRSELNSRLDASNEIFFTWPKGSKTSLNPRQSRSAVCDVSSLVTAMPRRCPGYRRERRRPRVIVLQSLRQQGGFRAEVLDAYFDRNEDRLRGHAFRDAEIAPLPVWRAILTTGSRRSERPASSLCLLGNISFRPLIASASC